MTSSRITMTLKVKSSCVVFLRSVCFTSLLSLSFSVIHEQTVKDLTPSIATKSLSLHYQDEHTQGVYRYNVSSPSSLYLEVQPCSGAFNWTFNYKKPGTSLASPFGPTLASGGYSHVELDPGDTLVGHHTVTYQNVNASVGSYYLVVDAGDGGWLQRVFFTLFISSSSRHGIPPRLPFDDRIKAVLVTRHRVRLTWGASSTSGIQYRLFYHKENDTDKSFAHGSTCSTHYTHARSKDVYTENSNYDVTGLIAGTTYNFNMIVVKLSSSIRSAYRGVRVTTLSDSDSVGEWSVLGRMETNVLVDHQQKSTYVKEKYERVLDFVVSQQSEIVKFLVRPCGGFVHWTIDGPNGTVLQQESFKGSDLTGVTTQGYLPRVSKELVLNSPQPGIYRITVRGGNHTTDFSSYVYFQIFATTHPDTYYYPELPANDKIRVVEHSTAGLTLEWDPSPTADVRYCVYYHEVKHSRPYFVQSSGCSTHYTSESIIGPCVTGTTVRLANRSSHSLVYSDTSYYINVVVFKPTDSRVRSAYVGVLVSTRDPTSPPPQVTVRDRQPDTSEPDTSEPDASEPATEARPRPITRGARSSTSSLLLSTLAVVIVTIVDIGLLM